MEFPSLQTSLFYTENSTGAQIVNPYQKPLKLYLQLLQMWVLPGSYVLDLTCGVGSLELAAMELSAPANLSIIAFEKSHYQFEHATSRLKGSCVVPTRLEDIRPDAESEDMAMYKKQKAARSAAAE